MSKLDSFKEKKILFFAPKFFDYGQEIANKLESLGSVVHYFDEKPDNDFWTKALVRVNKKILTKKIQAYYSNIFKTLDNDSYDVVFFLTPESISAKSLETLRSSQPGARFILYMWDSLKNRKNVIDLLPSFDYKYSFDKGDCTRPEKDFIFRPLFFLDEYKTNRSGPSRNARDLLFIGTVHSDRFRLLLKVKEECKRLDKTVFYFMFLQSRIIYYYRKLTDKYFRKSNINEFEFTSMTKTEILDKVNDSIAILDIQHPAQSGLTMRVIEMLGARKKVITTNKDIVNYDFYNTNNILYIDRDNPILNKDFFESGYKEIEADIYYKYSLEGWLREIFAQSN